MTHEEYTELRKYHSFAASLGTSDAVYRALRAADEAVLGDVEDAFFGFQWDNRLFLSTAANKANEFLGTLAHESEHVFRRAHLADYTEPSVLCREEFAAYGAEILLRKETLSKRDAAKIHARLRSLFDLSALQPDSCDKR
jgi:hypothetical protein